MGILLLAMSNLFPFLLVIIKSYQSGVWQQIFFALSSLCKRINILQKYYDRIYSTKFISDNINCHPERGDFVCDDNKKCLLNRTEMVCNNHRDCRDGSDEGPACDHSK